MANIVYGDELYNRDVKEEYLNSLKIGSRKIVERIFKVSYAMEKELDRDLYTFSRDELRRLFYLFLASTPNASKYNVNYVDSYLQWSQEMQYKKGLNPLESVNTEWKESFVVRPEENRFLKDTDIKEIINNLKNSQDAAVLYLLFSGVKGEKCAEITNLQRKDLDAENQTLLITDDNGSTRLLSVDAECIRLCNQAIKEQEYIKKNGNFSVETKSESSELVSNNYVIRLSNTRVVNTQSADENVVYRRLAMLSKEFDISTITPTSVFQSGMLYMLRCLLKEGRLNDDGYNEIAKQFNVSDAVLRRLKGDFLNPETVSEIYELT